MACHEGLAIDEHNVVCVALAPVAGSRAHAVQEDERLAHVMALAIQEVVFTLGANERREMTLEAVLLEMGQVLLEPKALPGRAVRPMVGQEEDTFRHGQGSRRSQGGAIA